MNYKNLNDPVLIRVRYAGEGLLPVQVQPKTIKQIFMKSTVKVKTEEMSKFLTAANWADVDVEDSKVVGPNTFAELKYNDAAKLLEMGGYIATLTPAQIKEDVDRRKAEAAAAKK
jgi:hypothetical protein